MSKAATIEASIARNSFAHLGERAKEMPLKVTRHGNVEFVIISAELYSRVEASGAVPASELERMEAQFEKLCQDMQSDRSNEAYAALEALPAEGLAGAVAKARNRLSKPEPRRRPKVRAVR